MFLNAVMLAGLGGAAVPLVVHLLSRWRYRNVAWGAMMFLEGMEGSRTHSAKLRQWTLLGVRMALVGMLALALARPVVRSRGGVGPEGRITAVIVWDRSYSMGYEEAGRSRFEKAREAVLQILAGLRKGDEVALVLMGEGVEVVHREPTGNLQQVARLVSDLQVSGGAAVGPGGLAAARTILNQPGRANRELYLVCDRQAASWQQVDNQWSAAFRQWLDDPRSPTRFYLAPAGGEETENVAITAVELVDAVAVRGQPTEVEVRVRNYGGTPSAGVELTLWLTTPNDGPRKLEDHGRKLKTVSFTVGARSTGSVRVPVTFDQVGSHVLAAEIKSADLPADNVFRSAIDVIDPIGVVIVSGDEQGTELRSESFFLKLALAPYQTALKKQGDPATVSVRGIAQWDKIDLSKYRVVILANVPQVTAEMARALEQKVYEGGGLILCPGSLSRIDNGNAVLYRGGLGLMPAKLEPPTPADGSRGTSLLGLELSHPIFRFLRGADPLPGVAVGRFFPVAERQADARVLGTYGSGEPFLIEALRGRGRVLLVTTPLDADWSTLPLQPFFLPFVQSMVRYASAPTLPSRNLAPGETLTASFVEGLDDPVVRLTRNDEPAVQLRASGASNFVFHADTQQSGIYRLEARVKNAGRRVVYFAVQSPRGESDLTPLTIPQWERFGRELGFTRLAAGRESMATALAGDREGRELWLVLLVGVMILGIGELWLARRWSQEVG
jgi:hypothetical protein